MAFLLRVELPDVPGSLGALATALGGAGADIEAIEIVEHRADGKAVDDVLLELPPSVMADALVTACHELDGVRVHWISRYNAGANLSMDLEAVEQFTSEPQHAVERLVEVVPATFRTDWAMALRRVESSTLLAGTHAKDRQGRGFVVVVGRHGGPEFLASELARLGHMTSLAGSVQA